MKRLATAVTAAATVLSGMFAGASEWQEYLRDMGIAIHGSADYRYGLRTRQDTFEDDSSLNEMRFQTDAVWYADPLTFQLKADLVYDDQAEGRNDIDLETGKGFIDLRHANILFVPFTWMDAKVGRQILTWGTGDLVFINDLFPKDWQSFFLGRADEYLKAPSDALFIGIFPSFANIDLVYTPRFDADRHITGERISYWNGQGIVGQNSVIDADRPDDWFDDDEAAARIYRSIGAYEIAVYGYYGFWKSPGGMDPATGRWIFPGLGVYGTSARGPVAGGIVNVEAGYYDSMDDRAGDDVFVNNSEMRVLIGYERELARNLTVGAQYYVERMMDYGGYRDSLDAASMPASTARDEDRHTVTLRLTYLAMNQNLVLGCFTRYSPSDEDVYVRPSATYKMSDRWQASIGGNFFSGRHEHTFLGQFENNSNVHASLRWSF